MVVSFGAVQGTRWAGRRASDAAVQLELLQGPEDSLRCSYKYMFQRLRDIRNGEGKKSKGNLYMSHFIQYRSY